MNESEALKCFDIAKQAVKDGLFDKAEKFLVKSIKLQQTEQAQVLLSRLDYLRSSEHKNRQKVAGQEPKPQKEENERPYTKEQADTCQQILKQKDYYQILGVLNTCTDDDLKKAFRKQAIKVHPDKNAAPRATDAFKKVNAAMECLSDPVKRRHYDQVGSSEAYENRDKQTNFNPQHAPEDIFSQFFYGQERPRQQRQRQTTEEQQRQEEAGNLNALGALLPLLLIIIISMLSNIGLQGIGSQQSTQYKYSFTQNYQFNSPVQTHRLNQQYFVTTATALTFQRNWKIKQQTDNRVEEELLQRYETACSQQKQKRQSYINQSKKYSTDTQNYHQFLKKAEQIDMTSCSTFKSYRRVLDQFKNEKP